MNVSLALMSLLLGVSLTGINANDPADLVRNRLEDNLATHYWGDLEEDRRLEDTLNTDFSFFVGTWYDCLHTTLVTFDGEPAEKHIIDKVGCEGGELGTVSNVGNYQQTLQFDIILLNHCYFHDLGREGQPPCPNDYLASDPRGEGNVLVKYSFTGIGSFADADRVEFFADHTFLRNQQGEWEPNLERAKIENPDTMVCQKHLDGIVCDWRINEYRTAFGESHDMGCKKNGQCRPKYGQQKCEKKGGEWTNECSRVETTEDGFVYDSFGSYYLVKDMAECRVDYCATAAPTSTEAPTSTAPPTSTNQIPGCYRGGSCNGSHGCCDCDITEEECINHPEHPGFWVGGCVHICNTP